MLLPYGYYLRLVPEHRAEERLLGACCCAPLSVSTVLAHLGALVHSNEAAREALNQQAAVLTQACLTPRLMTLLPAPLAFKRWCKMHRHTETPNPPPYLEARKVPDAVAGHARVVER